MLHSSSRSNRRVTLSLLFAMLLAGVTACRHAVTSTSTQTPPPPPNAGEGKAAPKSPKKSTKAARMNTEEIQSVTVTLPERSNAQLLTKPEDQGAKLPPSQISSQTPPTGIPALADYVPCGFTADAEALLRIGWTPPQDGNIAPKTQTNTDGGSTSESRDVGCSQAILTWEQARWAFGRKIADNYVVFQVTARNLNADQEFLIQDLQVAVADFGQAAASAAQPGQAAGYLVPGCPVRNGTSTHFMAGHDRMIVRGVGQTGQTFTARNISERVLEAVASVLGVTTAVAGTAQFSSAVHIFSAAGIPGFNKVIPDLSAEQIDRLNDLGFSASSAYKIVISKNGSVPMTTFVPSAVFAPGYRKWNSCDLLNFANNSVVVLGGKHIQEVADLATVNDLKCPATGSFLDLGKASGDDFRCTVTGADLQLLTSIRLKNDSDQKDQATIDGTPSVSGSTTSGSVTFSLKKLLTLAAPRYQAYTEGAKGESATTARVNLPPTAATLTPASIKLDGTSGCDAAPNTCGVKVQGNNLDLATGVKLLKSSDNSAAADGAWSGSSKTSRSATFQLADLKKLQAGDYLIGFVPDNGPVIPSTAKLTLAAAPGSGN